MSSARGGGGGGRYLVFITIIKKYLYDKQLFKVLKFLLISIYSWKFSLPFIPPPPSFLKGQLGFGWTCQNASVTTLLLLTPITARFSLDA